MEKSLHELAVRLCEGGGVWFQGHFIRAIEVPDEIDECMICPCDSECHEEMAALCRECDDYNGKKHYLRFKQR